MNELFLQEYNEERVVYLYIPEGKGKPGEIVYVFSKKEAEIARRAEEDPSGRYGHNAVRRIKECVEDNHNLPISTIQAWG